MEAQFGGKLVASDLKAPVGKKSSLEWDLNDWKWDGDRMIAAPLNPVPTDCGAWRQLSDLSNGLERDSEKRRREGGLAIEEVEEGGDQECLRLGGGGPAYPIAAEEEDGEGKIWKKSKVAAGAEASSNAGSNRAVCQVEDCRADLSGAKDYHRRHKVCDMHSKASRALVGNIMQRFCQQCSRFHVLQEFDEGKRSCRRRLAGHNRRRRKTHPDTVINGAVSLNDEKGIGYLLRSLLRILSNMQFNSSDQTRDQDLLSHLLKNLAGINGPVDDKNISALLQGSQPSFNAGTSVDMAQRPLQIASSHGPELRGPLGLDTKIDTNSNPTLNTALTRISVGDTTQCGVLRDLSGPLRLMDDLKAKSIVDESAVGRVKCGNFDLNSTYDDSQDCLEDPGSSHFPGNSGNVSLENPLSVQRDSCKLSPAQLSQNSDSTTTRSPSTSSGEAQSRTDRIVFKLFGKDPSDLPIDLRTQIFTWLSNTPNDIESYIRPGCIILTIYLNLEKCTWEELYSDLGSSLRKLLDSSKDPLWSTGWVYSRVRNYVAFTYDGHLVIDTPLPLENSKNCRILSIKPIAVSLSEKTQFVVKGFNICRPSTRLLCTLDGKYLVQESCSELMETTETSIGPDEIHSLRFSCSIPSSTGRGFIEVEDHGLSSSFFPFIVAEQEVCSEIRTLEGAIEVAESIYNVETQPNVAEAKNQVMDFIHEMGWLLHRSHIKSRLGTVDPHSVLFSFRRFRQLMEFSMNRDWCSVVSKLLSVLFEGSVDSGEFSSAEVAILDLGLLHSAVRRNCRPMVELLLKFVPQDELQPGSENQQAEKYLRSFIFKPNLVGPNGLTPLHVAASQVGFECVLDALTDDPGKVGIEAWKNARDETGLTPNDYACLRGHYSYIHLVQRKMTKISQAPPSESGHVVVNIPGTAVADRTKQQPEGQKTSKVASLEIGKYVTREALQQRGCRVCQSQPLGYAPRSSVVYRPAMLSMVAIAAVCVCVALLFKSSPEVLYVFRPFRWERLKYGSS